MQKPKHMRDKAKQKRLVVDWGGLGNEPRNENLAKMQGPTPFEQDKNDQDKESEPSRSYQLNKHKDRDPQR